MFLRCDRFLFVLHMQYAGTVCWTGLVDLYTFLRSWIHKVSCGHLCCFLCAHYGIPCVGPALVSVGVYFFITIVRMWCMYAAGVPAPPPHRLHL